MISTFTNNNPLDPLDLYLLHNDADFLNVPIPLEALRKKALENHADIPGHGYTYEADNGVLNDAHIQILNDLARYIRCMMEEFLKVPDIRMILCDTISI